MDEMVNTFLLAGDKVILEMHFRRPRCTYSACGPFIRSKEQRLHDVFIKTNYKELVFSMTWLKEILKICLKKQLLIKHCVIKHLTLLKVKNKIDIKEVVLQWFIDFPMKKLLVVL